MQVPLSHALYLTLSFFVLRLLNDSNVFATYNEICVRFCTCFVISHILYVCSPIKSEWIYVFISPFLSFSLLLLFSALVGSRRFAQLCHVVSLNNFQICYALCQCWCFCLHGVSDFRFSLNYVPFSFLLYSCFIFLAHTKIYCTYVMEVSLGISAMKSHYSPSSTPTPVLLLAPSTVHLSCAHFLHSRPQRRRWYCYRLFILVVCLLFTYLFSIAFHYALKQPLWLMHARQQNVCGCCCCRCCCCCSALSVSFSNVNFKWIVKFGLVKY